MDSGDVCHNIKVTNTRFRILLTILLFLVILFGYRASITTPTQPATATDEPCVFPGLPIAGRSLVARGKYVYLASGSKIQVIDVSMPAAPTVVGEVSTASNNSKIVLSGDRLYGVNFQYPSASRGSNEVVSVIDVSNPAAPAVVGAYESDDPDGFYATDMEILGNTAYVRADTPPGLLILSACAPGNPRRLAFDTTLPPGQMTAVDQSTFYIAEKEAVGIFQRKGPAQLVKAGYVCQDCGIYKITVEGNQVYLYQWSEHYPEVILSSYDIHNPLAPLLKESYRAANNTGVISNSRLYIIDEQGNLRIYSLGQKGSMTEIGSFEAPSVAVSEIFVSGSLAYLLLGADELLILDVSDPAAPRQMAHFDVYGNTFPEKLETIPDPADTQAPTCESMHDDTPIGGAPDTLLEVEVPMVATDGPNPVAYMRYSHDAKEWHAWMLYHTPLRVMVGIGINWGTIRIFLQYRDKAGNASQVCIWEKVSEGW